MDLAAIKELAWQSMGERITHPQREKGFIYYHGQRVAAIALQLRELICPGDESYDQVILVGGWFHDVGKGLEPHWEYGALIAREMLKEHCSPRELEQIVEIVQGHTLRKQRDYPQMCIRDRGSASRPAWPGACSRPRSHWPEPR